MYCRVQGYLYKGTDIVRTNKWQDARSSLSDGEDFNIVDKDNARIDGNAQKRHGTVGLLYLLLAYDRSIVAL
jgi:hypothetical protein